LQHQCCPTLLIRYLQLDSSDQFMKNEPQFKNFRQRI
jgi:hypothetical protein